MKGRKFAPTPEQWDILRRHYPHERNAATAARLGVSPRTVIRLARRLGLRKTAELMADTQRAAAAAAARSMAVRGNKAWFAKGSGVGAEHRFRPGLTNAQRNGPENEARRRRNSAESRRLVIAAERRRVLFGLPQKTRLKVFGGGRARVLVRHELRKAGYLVPRGSNTALRPAAVKPRPRLEARAAREHLRVVAEQEAGGRGDLGGKNEKINGKTNKNENFGSKNE